MRRTVQVWAWGRGEHGRLGFGDDKTIKAVPHLVELLGEETIVQVRREEGGEAEEEEEEEEEISPQPHTNRGLSLASICITIVILSQ